MFLNSTSRVLFSGASRVLQNFAVIEVEGFFFFAGHQVDVELGDADGGQGGQFFAVRAGGADDAEAVDDLVGDETGVVGAYFGVVEVVVAGAIADERG